MTKWWTCVLILWLATACSTTPQTLPTAAALPSLTPSNTPTVTPVVLPPTWTPAPSPVVPTDTPTADPSLVPTEGPTQIGTIYYLFNGQNILSISSDGSSTGLVPLAVPAGPINDLAVSPDGELVAYVAPGNGLAREVYVSRMDGTYTQQISCAGYETVTEPTWSRDGAQIAWVGQRPGAQQTLFVASFVGSNNCPADNNQRVLTDFTEVRSVASRSAQSEPIKDLAWLPDNETIVFSSGPIFRVDTATGTTVQVTVPGRRGPDSLPSYNSPLNRLEFLRRDVDTRDESIQGNYLYAVPVDEIGPGTLIPRRVNNFPMSNYALTDDGELLAFIEDGQLFISDGGFSVNPVVEQGVLAEPGIAFSPSVQDVAYVAQVPVGGIPQIFRVSADGERVFQLTQLTDGVIDEVIWLAN